MPIPSFYSPSRRGSALLLVVISLLLLVTLVVAFLSRATLERQLSGASANLGKTDLAAQGAVSMVISDLQQEIVDGSYTSATTASPAPATLASGYYYPKSSLNMVPQIVGFTQATDSGVEDLLKISKNLAPFYPATNFTQVGISRASSVSTTTDSLNGRAISTARWNAPLLMAKATPASTTDLTPVAAFTANPPDWIYVAQDGSNPTAWNATYAASSTNPVLQRYAYAIYDEGSTLDMNVAGSPAYTSGYGTFQPYKNALAYADLTQILSAATVTPPIPAATQQQIINAIVGWRNYATMNYVDPTSGTQTSQISSYFPLYSIANTPIPNDGTITPFDLGMLSNSTGFMSVSTTNLTTTTNSQGRANQSDNAFVSRQQLIQFLTEGLGQNPTFTTVLASLQNALPYLGTFSRGLSAPSYSPPPLTGNSSTGRPAVLQAVNGGNDQFNKDDTVNPGFLSTGVMVQGAFTRADGSIAVVGEPLVKKRFALSRLAWLTYKGPSALRTGGADIQALINNGIPQSYLNEGTAANIQAYFGLDWDASKSRWVYDYHNSGSAPATGSVGPIMDLGAIASQGAHDPDFFELLKAAVSVGSLGNTLVPTSLANPGAGYPGNGPGFEFPPFYNSKLETVVDLQIIQMGANIIGQYQTAGYPVRIAFNNGENLGTYNGLREYVSVDNYPYFYGVTTGVLPSKQPSASTTTNTVARDGIGVVIQIPIIWNPHDPSSSVGAVYPTKFRIIADQLDPDSLLAGGSVTDHLMCWAYSSTGNGNSNAAGVTFDSVFMAPAYNQGADPAGADSTYRLSSTPGPGSSNSAIDLPIAGNLSTMFREPTAIMTSKQLKFGSGNVTPILEAIPQDQVISTRASLSGIFTAVADPTGTPSQENYNTNQSTNDSYLGFYLGAFPLAWKSPAGTAALAGSAEIATVTGASGGSTPGTYITYRMQYQDLNNNWITYDTKYGAPLGAGTNNGDAVDAQLTWGTPAPTTGLAPSGQFDLFGAANYAATVIDPRTYRFGMFSHLATNIPIHAYDNTSYSYSELMGPEDEGVTAYSTWWTDTNNNVMSTFRADSQSGEWFEGPYLPIAQSTGWNLSIGTDGDGTQITTMHVGLFSQNGTQYRNSESRFMGDGQVTDKSGSGDYYADPDGVVRRAAGGYVPGGGASSPGALIAYGFSFYGTADTSMGLPMTRISNYSSGSNGVPIPSSPPPSLQPGLSPSYTIISPSTAAIPNQAESRPYILHRPFRSVAEMGYAFRDTPWKNVNFYMPESGDSALLDVFTLSENTTPNAVEAGKVNLNTRQPAVLAAVLSGAYLDDPETAAGGTTATAITAILNGASAMAIANGIIARTTDINPTDISNGAGPFTNISELVGKWNNQPLTSSAVVQPAGVKPAVGLLVSRGFIDGMNAYKGFSGTYTQSLGVVTQASADSPANSDPMNLMKIYTAKSTSSTFGTYPTTSPTGSKHAGLPEAMAYTQRLHEAPIRALVNTTQTRVWNLMIDVISQTGRFPQSAENLGSFSVEGERRCWVHVAIDRFTGKVIDEQIENVKE
jgi:hypothetical protein